MQNTYVKQEKESNQVLLRQTQNQPHRTPESYFTI